MDWKTYLDGLIGGTLGGVIGAGAAFLTARQQIKAQTNAAEAERLELRRDRSRTAAAALLERLADVSDALWYLPHLADHRAARYEARTNGGADSQAVRTSSRTAAAEEAVRSVRRGLLTELPVIADPLITKHYTHLDTVVFWFSVVPLTPEESERVGVGLGRYIRWLQMLVANYVAVAPPPADVQPPSFVPGHILDADDDWEPDPKPEGWS